MGLEIHPSTSQLTLLERRTQARSPTQSGQWLAHLKSVQAAEQAVSGVCAVTSMISAPGKWSPSG